MNAVASGPGHGPDHDTSLGDGGWGREEWREVGYWNAQGIAKLPREKGHEE